MVEIMTMKQQIILKNFKKAGQSFKSTFIDSSIYDEIWADAIMDITGAFSPHREKKEDGSTKLRLFQGCINETF